MIKKIVITVFFQYLSLFILLSYSLTVLPSYAFAQSLTLPGGTAVTGPTGFRFTTIGSIISYAIPFVFAAAGIGLLLMLLSGGFSFLTSAGDAKKLESGKQRLVNALLGFFIIFLAYWLVQGLGIIFGFDLISSIFK